MGWGFVRNPYKANWSNEVCKNGCVQISWTESVQIPLDHERNPYKSLGRNPYKTFPWPGFGGAFEGSFGGVLGDDFGGAFEVSFGGAFGQPFGRPFGNVFETYSRSPCGVHF